MLPPPPFPPVTRRTTTVHVVAVPVLRGAALDAMRARLDAAERLEADRRPDPAVHARYVTGRAALRSTVAHHTGIPPDRQRWTRRCRVCGGPHGTPVLQAAGHDGPAPHVSVSSTPGRVVVALCAAPVGADVENPTGTIFDGFDEVALTPEERVVLDRTARADRARARAITWTRKEALLKATGHGLRIDPAGVRLTSPTDPPALLDWRDADVPRPVATITDLHLPDGFVGAVAVLDTAVVDVHVEEVTVPSDAPTGS